MAALFLSAPEDFFRSRKRMAIPEGAENLQAGQRTGEAGISIRPAGGHSGVKIPAETAGEPAEPVSGEEALNERRAEKRSGTAEKKNT